MNSRLVIRLSFAVLLALICTACGQSSVSPAPASAGATAGVSASSGSSPSPAPRPSGQPPSAANPVPVIVDTDLAADDLYALLVLLRDPAVDLRAITIAGTGEVHCVPGLRNTRRLLTALGRPEIPVACGRQEPGPNGRWFPPDWRSGADAFYGVELPPVDGETARDEDAPELLVRLTAESDVPLTLVTLGPLSNVADAAKLDPAFASRVAGIHAMAGTIDAPGNIELGDTKPSDRVEWNVGADPDAMAAVLALDVPITLVGLDATNDVPVPTDIVEQLSGDHAAAGADIVFEMYAKSPFLASSESSYWDPLAAATLTDPSIAGWEDLEVSMQPTGAGAGRLSRDPGGRPVRAAMSADREAFMTRFLAALRTGAPRPDPFTVRGSMTVHWDGKKCRIEGDPPTNAGLTSIKLINESEADVVAMFGGVTPPKHWKDLIGFIRGADFGDPNLSVPEWAVPVPGNVSASPGSSASSVVQLPAGELGAVCATGTWPDLEFFDAGAFTLED